MFALVLHGFYRCFCYPNWTCTMSLCWRLRAACASRVHCLPQEHKAAASSGGQSAVFGDLQQYGTSAMVPPSLLRAAPSMHSPVAESMRVCAAGPSRRPKSECCQGATRHRILCSVAWSRLFESGMTSTVHTAHHDPCQHLPVPAPASTVQTTWIEGANR